MKYIFSFLSALLTPLVVGAHVGYVIEGSLEGTNVENNIGFLLGPLSQASNLIIILITIVIVGFLFLIYEKSDSLKEYLVRVGNRAGSYKDLLPWMLRLSLGIALLGAGTSGVLISPALEATPLFSLIQVVLGFFLLSGFLTGLAATGAAFLYLTALFSDAYILGNLDFFGIAVALVFFASSRPGIDDIFGIPFLPRSLKMQTWAPVVARISIGLAMTYLAIYEKFLNPEISALVVEKFNMTTAIPVSPAMWVLSAGLVELVVGLLLIFGWRPRLVSAVAFLVLTASFFFFKEAVYSHITLFGTLSVIFASGGKKL